jgi:magnesium transporter
MSDATGEQPSLGRDDWRLLSDETRCEVLRLPPSDEAEDLFVSLSPDEQAEVVLLLPGPERRFWLRALPPDDLADLLQAVADEDDRHALFALLDDHTQSQVTALLAYAEDDAGGLMSPRYARLRPDMRVAEAIEYLRMQARLRVETLYYAYVLDHEQHLLGVVSFRELIAAPSDRLVSQMMEEDLVCVEEDMDQEEVGRLISEHDLLAVPVVDAERRLKGIVTVDDIVDVVEEEATEDIQKMGGSQALDLPYLRTNVLGMLRKRAPWLTALFLGEMLTAAAMARYEDEIARAVVLALFIPLIISSGGNSGSQATTLVIRAMALGEVRGRDWWRVFVRELLTGLCLGLILGLIGFARVALWPNAPVVYTEYYLSVAVTVGVSLVAVVMFGTLAGSTLPFLLRRLGCDPASASAPFVATLVDVSGVLIYFNVAYLLLRRLMA